jgi:hypothetical protein
MACSCSSTSENKAMINSTVVMRLSSQGKDVTLLDVHFISSSPVELLPAYRGEGDTRHVQNVEGED